MNRYQVVAQFLLCTIVAGLFSCATIPKGAEAVSPFAKEKYLGKWYEIARLDFKFERHLDNTTADYSLNKNGTVRVENRGYHTKKEKWKQAIGKAKFVKDENTGMLKVSFFGPFYAGYNVIALDSDYRYALVAGKNEKYLWILSRTPDLPSSVKEQYLALAQEVGYKTQDLVWVNHDQKKDKH
jgi:apolipoprotein D and lipocalin family protein